MALEQYTAAICAYHAAIHAYHAASISDLKRKSASIVGRLVLARGVLMQCLGIS